MQQPPPAIRQLHLGPVVVVEMDLRATPVRAVPHLEAPPMRLALHIHHLQLVAQMQRFQGGAMRGRCRLHPLHSQGEVVARHRLRQRRGLGQNHIRVRPGLHRLRASLHRGVLRAERPRHRRQHHKP